METITFYSYKGGSGRSLALANAAVYLAKLGFKVVALDFDLEAPGLHYKFSRNEDDSPLAVQRGIVDYVNDFRLNGEVSLPLKDFAICVPIPGIERPMVHLIPAGRAPSPDYWSMLSAINWHDLFYEKGAQGVQIFKELQARILDEFQPDFLLVDSRTGITEMGGVATTLLADKVLCLVLPTLENLDGARTVLQSLKRSRREGSGTDLEIMVAVSRLPKMRGSEDEREREVTKRILSALNQDSGDSKDALQLKEVFVLHSEAALQVREELRVGGGTNPDDSILLRDYLRLFAPFVPKESIEPKLNDLIQKAWAKLRHDPDAAVKDMEQYAESFGHPETYRELLRFYQVRNASSASILRRAQRLWEITRDSGEEYLWAVVRKHFEPTPSFQRKPAEWYPDLDFMRALWREAGAKDPDFGLKLAEAYGSEDKESTAADVMLEIIRTSEPSSRVVSHCIYMLDYSKRGDEAEELIQRFKAKLGTESDVATAWARHALRSQNKAAAVELTASPVIARLRPSLAGLLHLRAGNPETARPLAQAILGEIGEREVARADLDDLGTLFRELGLFEEFEKVVTQRYPMEVARELRDRPLRSRRM
jgi:MinD-like ATPase involved in chromosome partitioning or flagellar assembly